MLPSALNTGAQGYGLEVYRDRLTVHYKQDARHSSDVGSIQADKPVPINQLLYYFEATVLEPGNHCRTAIGFTDQNFKLTKQPGWEIGSYGYHGDDGHKFGGSGKGEEYGPKFGKGDTVGACYHLGRQEIFFTKNGNRLKTAFRQVKGELFPTIGLHSKGEIVRVNFGPGAGQPPFKYDIEALVSDERAAQAVLVERTPIAAYDVHRLVRQYFVHYGYGDTLRAYDGESGFADPSIASDQAGATSGGDVEMAEMDPVVDAAAGDAAGPSESPSRMDADNGDDAGSSGRYSSLDVRQAVRRAIMCGDIKGATERIHAAGYSKILNSSGQSEGLKDFECARFHLVTQQYIELIRSGDIDAAVHLAQSALASLDVPSGSPSRPAGSLTAGGDTGSGGGGGDAAGDPSRTLLRDIVALVAYEKPEDSPLAWLLGTERREQVADAVNAAILVLAEDRDPAESQHHPESGLERGLRQMVVVHEALLQLRGGQGEAFRLRDHLIH